MITPKGFVLLGSKSGGMRAGAHTKHTKANQPAGPLARASGAWYLLHRAVVLTCVFRGVVFCGVASLSSVDLSLLLWTAAGSCTGCYTQAWCTHTHKLGTHTHKLAKKRHQITGITRARENQHTEASCCHMSESSTGWHFAFCGAHALLVAGMSNMPAICIARS